MVIVLAVGMITREPKLTRQPAWPIDESMAEAILPMPGSSLGLEYHKLARYQLRYLTWLVTMFRSEFLSTVDAEMYVIAFFGSSTTDPALIMLIALVFALLCLRATNWIPPCEYPIIPCPYPCVVALCQI